MKITTTQEKTVNIELDDNQQKNIALTYLENILNWSRDYFIEDGRVCCTKTYYTSHSWNKKEVVREASENDILVNKIFKQL
jgi:hypothetical protein|tara:strand:+ start:274 stop:516 length:243 start_codon:yes stop_codon:yes gene_type:complete